ncbi:indolepyruvate/phenylpyruvate decarboxylase [Paucibacter sediminis]|uniref:Indolepyruvate/phenylpyruvate decarboxylase n=1 Tax=Paucibacter sediminis TaxID=3019553 RepID=A0AA95NED6_9BURK|nr:indolepyruvate/phenylpyruvate decarboxylase [Paucibacter sp. S2-9]WIT10608.1 indolepyruvate/phenylpyruvate decarboxylase [Paucibacter sp. S2-9]
MWSNLTEQLLHALKARGATEIFGIPGDFALPLFRAIERAAILPLYTLSHEPGLGFAADAAARVRGGLGVAAVTYGAGALNMVNPVANAYAERVPLVVLSGAPAAHEVASGLLLHHQVKALDSQWRIFEELTVDRARLDDPVTAPALIARVLDSALRRAGPVYLEIPRDMPERACAAPPELPPPPLDRERLAACADELLARLRAARHPLLLVGVEIRRYGIEAQVAELARRLNIPVATTLMGRGLLVDSGVQHLGTYLGLAGDPELTEAVEGSDALLLLGAIICDSNFAVSRKRIDFRHAIRVWQGEVEMGHHVYRELPIKELVEALLLRVMTRPPQPFIETARATPELPAPDAPLTPAAIAAAANALMQKHGALPVACDMGDCLFTAMDLTPTDLIAPGYYATMGYGVPAALGLQVATGRRPLVLVGDGAFQMTGWELGNARAMGCDPIVLLLNNASWEMLRTFEPEGRYNGRGAWDFAAMAAGMGGRGYEVHTVGQLVEALACAQAERGRFQLLDLRLAPGVLSPTLQRFVGAVKRLSMPG